MTVLQSEFCQAVGFLPTTPNIGTSTLALSASTAYLGFSFVAQAATSLSATRVYVTAKAGTGGTLNCELWSDVNGSPGTKLDTLTPGAPSASAWLAATGGTYSLTQGVKYWAVWYNSDALPATNDVTLSYLGLAAGNNVTSNDVATSANTGVTWTQKPCGGGARFDFANTTYGGWPVSAAGQGSSFQIYSSRECGNQLIMPANGKLIIAGLAGFLRKTGTPTGNVLFNLRDASHNLIASTDAISNGDAIANTTKYFHRYFSSAYGNQTLQPSTTYTISMAESVQSDASGNNFELYEHTIDSDSNSAALIPWSMQVDYYNGTSWAQTAGSILTMGMLLASSGEFASSGGGGTGFFIQ